MEKPAEKNWPWPNAPLSRDTEILTTSGWRRVDNICVGDVVLTRKDQDTALEWNPVLAVPFSFAEYLYHFKSKSVDQMVTPQHTMVVESTIDGKLIRKPAQELVDHPFEWKIPLTGVYNGYFPPTLFGLPSRDVMELLGWYIAEGWVAGEINKNGEKAGSICISQSKKANPEKCQKIESLLQRLNLSYNYMSNRYQEAYIIHSRQMPLELKTFLQARGTNCYDKSLPEWIFGLHPELLTHFLYTAILGDGHIHFRDNRPNVYTYSTTSEVLANQIQILTTLIGMRGTISVKAPVKGGTIKGRVITATAPLYTVSMNHKQYGQVRRMKIEKIPYNDYAYCVTVKNHAICIRRNGIVSFTGNSNIFIPLIPDKVEGLVSRIYKSCVKPDPLLIFKGTTPEAEQYAPLLERYYNRKVNNLGYREKLRELISLSIRDGLSFLEVNRERTVEMMPILSTDKEGNLVFKKEQVFSFDDDTIEAQRLKDVYVIPGHAQSMDKVFGIAKRFWLRPDEAKEEVKAGRMYKEILDVTPPGVGEYISYIDSDADDTANSAIQLVDQDDLEIGEWECFSVVIKYDIDNDGHREWCRFLIQNTNATLLYAEEYPYNHRQLNMIPCSPQPRDKSLYGYSTIERLEDIQREINSDRNQRRDTLTITIGPPIKRLAHSPTKLDAKPWGPLQVFDVADMNDLQQMDIRDIPPSAWMEEASLLQMADRLTATPTMPLPKEATKAEVVATQAESALKFDLIVTRIQEVISKMGQQLFWLDKQYVTETGYGFVDELNGKYVEMTVPFEAFELDYEIHANGDFVTFDRERRRQDLLFLYDLLLKNPLLVGIPQAGMPPNFQRIYHLTRMVLQEWDVKDIESMIGKEEEYVQTQQPPPGGMGSPGGDASMGVPGGGLEGLQALFNSPNLLGAFGGGFGGG